jgi:hypothetical protein
MAEVWLQQTERKAVPDLNDEAPAEKNAEEIKSE